MEVIDSKKFEEKVIKANKTVLVDMFATWCGPCKMLSPILENVKEDVGEKFDIYKVDIDESMDIARKYGIMSVPTMLIFKNGEVVDKMIGLRQKDQIIKTLNENI